MAADDVTSSLSFFLIHTNMFISDDRLQLHHFHHLSQLRGFTHFITPLDVSDNTPLGPHNRRAIAQHLGFAESAFLIPRQVHGSAISIVNHSSPRQAPPADTFHLLPSDALLTTSSDLCLMVLTADCVPILLCDPTTNCIGVVHAGWRGTAASIARIAISSMVDTFHSNPSDILVGLGPCIGPCCFEVGPDVASQLGHEFLAPHSTPSHLFIDLRAANVSQLLASGIPLHNIEVADICTSCSTFPSHRRDKAASRLGTAILRPSSPHS